MYACIVYIYSSVYTERKKERQINNLTKEKKSKQTNKRKKERKKERQISIYPGQTNVFFNRFFFPQPSTSYTELELSDQDEESIDLTKVRIYIPFHLETKLLDGKNYDILLHVQDQL